MTASAGPALLRLHREFADRIGFVTLYVREAHPGDRYPQPTTFEQKLPYARDYQARDAIPWPVAVDDCGFSPFGDDVSTARETAFDRIRSRALGTELAAKELGV